MKVRECFDLNPTGNTNTFSDYINYIDTSSVSEGYLKGVSYLESDFPSRAQRLVIQGDILYSSVRPNGDTLFAKITPCLENGKTGFVMGLPEGEVFGGSTEFVVLRSKSLNPYYVYCLARSYYFRQTAILSMNGADGRQRVDEDKLKSTKIVQPPKSVLEQFELLDDRKTENHAGKERCGHKRKAR